MFTSWGVETLHLEEGPQPGFVQLAADDAQPSGVVRGTGAYLMLSGYVVKVEPSPVDSLTPEFLEAERKKCKASQIIVEYNGMWQIQDFYVNSMPSI